MLRFFKTNAFYQIFSLLILFILIRLPSFIYKMPLLIPEVKWQLTGESLVNGNLLYVDVLDNLGPLSAFIYAIVHFLVGRSIFAYHLIAFILTLFHIFYFTLLAHRKGLFLERNYVPGLILITFYSLSFDFLTLSPALMGSTFLLLAFGSFIKQIERFGATDEVFGIGAYIGIAFLFYPPLCVFFIWVLLALNLYTGASLRQQFLVIFGFIFPITLVGIWYFIDGHFSNFYQYFILSIFQKRQFIFNNINGLISSYLLPLILAVLGFFVALSTSKYSNFQTRAQQLVLLWVFFGLLSIVLMPFFSPMQFIPFVLPFAYFTILFFANYKKGYVGEIIFLVVFAFIIFVNFQAFLPSLSNKIFSKLDNQIVQNLDKQPAVSGKKIFVLGNDIAPYVFNQTSTPYINWSLAKYEFTQLNNYENVINIISNFEKDPPQYIFDQENFIPKLFERIPELNKKYVKVGDGLYKKK